MTKLKTQWIGIWVIAIAVAASFAIFFIRPSFADIYFFFQDGKEIQVAGNIAGCVPTHGLDICIPGFRDSDGNYFVLSNMQEIVEANRDRMQTGDRFVIDGLFTFGNPGNPAADVVGTIGVTSMMNDNTSLTIP